MKRKDEEDYAQIVICQLGDIIELQKDLIKLMKGNNETK